MSKVAVAFWSGTGNTEEMAGEVLEGAKLKGAEAELFEIESFSVEKMDEFDAVAFGCPAMGDEVLEETVFEPVFLSCESKLNGKNIALFGSYGWGDGEWMRNWEDMCREKGANLVCDSVICADAPDEEAKKACRDLGASLA